MMEAYTGQNSKRSQKLTGRGLLLYVAAVVVIGLMMALFGIRNKRLTYVTGWLTLPRHD